MTVVQVQYNEGLQDLDPLGKQKHVCALHSCVYIYICFCGALNPIHFLISSFSYLKIESLVETRINTRHKAQRCSWFPM